MPHGPVPGFGGPGSEQRLLTRAFAGPAGGLLLLDARGRILAADLRAEDLPGRRATAMAGTGGIVSTLLTSFGL
ncbi:hypothetical protein [Kitasatospora sp. NPDC056531]|uniref:hypothetical protein n=1 Tax=Kitasatospora sp. NPDC056531 TaxID=3345856 RepID=UPI00369EDE3A